MRVIDAHTGREVQTGDLVPDHRGGYWELLEVEDRIFRARARVREPDGRVLWIPLIVRFTHPRFFLERVLFVPT